MKYKAGDRVKIIKECNCQYWKYDVCRDIVGIYQRPARNESGNRIHHISWIVDGLIHQCDFRDDQVKLIEEYKKEIKVYNIVKFMEGKL